MFDATGFFLGVNVQAMIQMTEIGYDHTSKCFVTNQPILAEWFACSYTQATQHLRLHDLWHVHEMLDRRAPEIQAFIANCADPLFPSHEASTLEAGMHGGRGPNKDSVPRKTQDGDWP